MVVYHARFVIAISAAFALLISLTPLFGWLLPLRHGLAYTVWYEDAYRIGIYDWQRGAQMLLPADYRPYQHFYGFDAQGHFVFLSDRDMNTEVYRWDGYGITNISQHPFNDWRPAVHPDGRVAFMSERDGNTEIYVWENGTLTNITQTPSAGEDYPAWSRDGRLAFVSSRDGNNEIYVWDGQNTFNISNSPGIDMSPHWSPDGRISFTSERNGGWELMVWSDGVVTATSIRSDPNSVTVWSSDGRLSIGQELFDVRTRTYTPLTQLSMEVYAPAWSAADTRGCGGCLAFVTLGSSSDIWVWDGRRVINLTNSPESENAPVWTP